jgi:catechol 2,3-dioxygenase-like lactoylglutathione lyase family enzyme
MLSHVTLGSNDMTRAREFYDAVLAPLGYLRLADFGEDGVGYGPRGNPEDRIAFWVLRPFNRERASAGNGWHVAFLAPTRQAVRDFHAKALELGGRDEGTPGLRADYHPHYYGAYVRDPDGNKLQAVCHEPE